MIDDSGRGKNVFLDVADRDEMMQDMKPARDEDFERLDELLANG